jgi:hypothetical protein
MEGGRLMNDMTSKSQKKFELELAEFMDRKLIEYTNRFQFEREAKAVPFKTAPEWYKRTLLSVAHDICEHYL